MVEQLFGDLEASGLSAAVLAGGASSRMGRNKALLLMDGVPLIGRVVEALQAVSDDLLVSTNTPDLYPFLPPAARFVADQQSSGRGPLVGIASVLHAARHPRVLVVATDMPFLHVALLRYLAQVDPTADVVVPVASDAGLPEPLHAIYHKRVLPVIEAQLRAGNFKVAALFEQVRTHVVPFHELLHIPAAPRSFLNVNTPDEWAMIRDVGCGIQDAGYRMKDEG